MKAETIKVKMPIITEEELQYIDDNFEEIVDKAERVMVAKKEQITWQRLLSKQKKIIKDLKERNDKLESQYRNRDFRCIILEQRNERLNNIIKEIRKLADKYEMGKYDYNVPSFEIKEILDKENK